MDPDEAREKRSMACSNCRRLKVKCVHSDPNDLSSPCIRCLKGKKDCRYQVTRRRKVHRMDISPHSDVPVGPTSNPTSATQPSFVNGIQHQFPNLPMKDGDLYDATTATGFNTNGSTMKMPLMQGLQLQQTPSPTSVSPTHTTPSSAADLPQNISTSDLTQNLSLDSVDPNASYTYSLPLQGQQGLRLFQIEATPRLRYMNARIMEMRNTLITSWKAIAAIEARNRAIVDNWESLGYKRVGKPENNVIAQGIITAEEAWARLEEYKNHHHAAYKVVDIPPGDTLDEIIRNGPILFHCIMDIVSTSFKHSDERTAMILHTIASTTLVYEIMIEASKSMELLYSSIIMQMWYNEPMFYHRQKIQLNSAACRTLAYDLGLGGRQPHQAGTYTRNPVEEIMNPHMISEHTSIQSYKAWLYAYCQSFLPLHANQGPTALFWNQYTADAARTLGEYLPQEPYVYRVPDMATFVHIQEKITYLLLKKDNDSSPVDIDDPDVHKLVTELDAEIERERNSRPASSYGPYLCCKTFLHQYVLHGPYNQNVGRSLFTNLSLRLDSKPLNSFAAQSFRNCCEYSLAYLQMLLNLSPQILSIYTVTQLSHALFNTSLLIKCRMLSTVNKAYADVCTVPDSTIDTIGDVVMYFDQICKEYPYLNTLRSVGFIMKIIATRSDDAIHRILQYVTTSGLDIQRNDSENRNYMLDDEDLMNDWKSQTPDAVPTLSQMMDCSSTMRQELRPDENGPLDRRQSEYRRGSLDRSLSISEEQLLNLGEDFWKDVIPNEGLQWFDF